MNTFEKVFANIGAFFMTALMLLTIGMATARPDGMNNGLWTDDVLVYYQDKNSQWHAKTGKVEHIPKSRVGVCVWFKANDKPSCWFTIGDTTLFVDVPMVDDFRV